MTIHKSLVEQRFRWAKEHIKALETEVTAFLDRKPYRLEVQDNRERTEYTFRIRIRESPPDHWPFVVSDTAHNLRASLDNLAFNLAGCPSGKRGEDIEFPIIYRRRNGGRPLFDKLKDKKLAGVHPDAVAIIESVQPYHGFRLGIQRSRLPHPLSILHHMSNADKHRTPLIGFFKASEIRMASKIAPIEMSTTRGLCTEDNAIIGTFRFAQPNVDVHSPATTIELRFKIPGRYPPLPLDIYLSVIAGLIEKDILSPLRPYMR